MKGYFAVACEDATTSTNRGFIAIYDLYSCSSAGCDMVTMAAVGAMPDSIYW